MKYEILEHTADAKIRAFGKTKEELFLNAMLGMGDLLRAKGKKEKLKIRKVSVRSVDANALLVDFLSEINYLRDVHMEVYDKVRFTKFCDTELDGEVEGVGVEWFGEDIKAVTFHGLRIRQNSKGIWEAAIVFDI